MMMGMVVMMRRLLMCLDDISSHIREGSKDGHLMGGHHSRQEMSLGVKWPIA